MKIVDFDEKENTVYILTETIMCDTKNMTYKERVIAMNKHFALSYDERIELSPYKEQIKAEIAKHPGCKISEFTDAYIAV